MGFWDDKRPPKEDFASKDDRKKLQKDMERLLKDKGQPDTKGASQRIVGSMKKGFGDIVESLSHPEHGRRMRISQMPKRPPIARSRVENPIAGRGAGIKRRKISYAPDSED
jgi:hypothetical protein